MNNIPEYSVSEITNLTKNILEENFGLIKVRGEIIAAGALVPIQNATVQCGQCHSPMWTYVCSWILTKLIINYDEPSSNF